MARGVRRHFRAAADNSRLRRANTAAIPYAVGLYITSAYWFTASTSFANPAVTIARSISDTFAGIAPAGVAAFIAAQLAGMLAAVLLAHWLWTQNEEHGCMTALPDRRVVIPALGITQIFAWGSTFYLPAALAPLIAGDTGWPYDLTVGGVSVGLLVAGLASPRVGRFIADKGGRPILAIGALLLAAGLGHRHGLRSRLVPQRLGSDRSRNVRQPI